MTSIKKRAAIVGAGLGGLSAAIRLRLAGFDVCLFEANPEVGGRASRILKDGFSFDTGPSLLNYPWVFEQLFAAAGRKMGDYVTLQPVDPSITFLWKNGDRFTLSSRLDVLIQEVEKFEPDAGVRLHHFFERASEQYRIAFEHLVTKNADSPLEWIGTLRWSEFRKLALIRSLEGELRRSFRSERVRQALGSYAMYLGGSPFELPGIFSILPYGELAHGLWLPRGGIYGLVEGIRRLCDELGIEVRCSNRVEQITTNDGHVTGLITADGIHHVYDIVLSNVDVPTTKTRLLRAYPLGASDRRAWRMTPGVITFYWGIRREVPGLPHHSIYLPDDYAKTFRQLMRGEKLAEDLPFYVSVPSSTDSSLAPKGGSVVFVLVPTPVLSKLGRMKWKNTVHEVKEAVLGRLRAHGISLAEGDFAVDQSWTPEDWRDRFGLYDGSAFGAAHTLFQMGPFRSKNYDRNVRGLYYVGASTTPGTGMPMVVLGGMMTAERILSHVQ